MLRVMIVVGNVFWILLILASSVHALTIIEQADEAYQKGDIKKAAQYYQWALSKNTTSIPAKNGLAKAYFAKNKSAKSESIYNDVLKVSPNDYEAKMGLAMIYMRQEKWLDAKDVLLEMHMTDKNNLHVMTRLMNAYIRLGELDAADQIHQLIKKQGQQ